MYLAKRSNVAEGSILNNLIGFAWVAQLCVALRGLGRKADACGLGAGWIRGVEVVVPLENHQLTLSLGDVCGEGLQDVAERHLHLGLQLSTCSQAGGQLHFIKLPTVAEEMTERSTGKTYLMDHIRFSGHARLGRARPS